MKKGYIKLLIACLVLIALLLINIVFDILNSYTYVLFLFATFFGLVLLVGFEKEKALFKKDMIIITIISCMFYYIVTYMAGLFIGFLKNSYNLKILSIINNVFPVLAIILLEELIRYDLIKKGERNKSIIFLTLVVFVLMDITLIINRYDFGDINLVIEFVFLYFLVSIFNNVYSIYSAYKSGYTSGIIYRIIMKVPMYFAPIIPSLGQYVESVLKMSFPIILTIIMYKMTTNNKVVEASSSYKYKNTFIILSVAIILLIIGINSRWFKLYSLTIGSGSMQPNINIGDVIIVEKISKEKLSSLKDGDILVFNHSDKIIVHRIYSIKKINNNLYVSTKGDANNDIDNWITEEKDIIGTTKIRLPYIGYPTVLLSRLMNQ